MIMGRPPGRQVAELRKDASPWVRHALYLLRDGEWHDFAPFMTELAKMVPPGMAFRRAEKERSVRKGSPTQRSRPLTTEQILMYGARAEVRTALRGMIAIGRIEYEYENSSSKR